MKAIIFAIVCAISLMFNTVDALAFDDQLEELLAIDYCDLTPEQLRLREALICEYKLRNLNNKLEANALCYFTGDVMCLGGQQRDAKTGNTFDFWPSYKYVATIFDEADFVCGNLETLLSESNPITKDQVNAANGSPQCNGPEVLLSALKDAGYDMFVTANNHSYDWRANGITETKKHLDDWKFLNTGTHYDNDNTEPNYCIYNANGIRVGVLSYTHLVNQRSLLNKDGKQNMLNLYDIDTIKKDIKAARKAGAEFIVVYCHWGTENTEKLNDTQLNDSKAVAEAGADLIIGSHPHCLQKCDYISTSDGRQVLCMFSMGNFCSSMTRTINKDTIILRVELNRSADGTISSESSYIPCRMITYEKRQYVVMPTSKTLNGGLSNSELNDATKRINKIMNNVIPEYSGQ